MVVVNCRPSESCCHRFASTIRQSLSIVLAASLLCCTIGATQAAEAPNASAASAAVPARKPQGIKTSSVTKLLDLEGQGSHQLSLPSDVTVVKDNVYVVDSGNDRISVFSRRGEYRFSFGDKPSGDSSQSLNGPLGIDSDERGFIYVADRNNFKIQVFGPKGEFVHAFPVTVNGTPIKPVDVAVHPENERLYVTGNTNHRVMAFTRVGELLNTWGGNGMERAKFRYPASLALTPDYDIAVVDVLNSRVQVFDPDGAFLVSVGTWGVLPGQLVRPKGIAIGPNGHFFVSDGYLELIQVYDGESQFLHVLGTNGQPENMVTAAGIAFDDDHRLYVCKMLENKVSVYALSVPPD